MGLLDENRKVEDMSGPSEWLNNVGWELGVAVGTIDPTAAVVDVDWDELLRRSVQLIEYGLLYEQEYVK